MLAFSLIKDAETFQDLKGAPREAGWAEEYPETSAGRETNAWGKWRDFATTAGMKDMERKKIGVVMLLLSAL